MGSCMSEAFYWLGGFGLLVGVFLYIYIKDVTPSNRVWALWLCSRQWILAPRACSDLTQPSPTLGRVLMLSSGSWSLSCCFFLEAVFYPLHPLKTKLNRTKPLKRKKEKPNFTGCRNPAWPPCSWNIPIICGRGMVLPTQLPSAPLEPSSTRRWGRRRPHQWAEHVHKTSLSQSRPPNHCCFMKNVWTCMVTLPLISPQSNPVWACSRSQTEQAWAVPLGDWLPCVPSDKSWA